MLIYVFGDTHGCYDLTLELVARVEAHAGGRDHRRVWLGDYIDRGSQSAQLVSYLIESKATRPQDVFLIGNHEDMLLANLDDWPSPYPAATRDILAKSFLLNGGAQTLSSYGVRSVMELPPDAVDARTVIETVLALYVMQDQQPGRFKGDQAFRAQLVRRVRGLTPLNADTYRDPETGKAKRVYRDLSQKTVQLMSLWIAQALGPAGLKFAKLEREDEQREREELRDYYNALDDAA